MTFKVVRNAQGVAVDFGPNDDNYEPSEAYTVEAAVAAGDQDLKDWYEFSTAFERLNPQVVAMGEALSVSPASLDDLWTLGASL